MKDPAASRTTVMVLFLLAFGWLLFFQPMPALDGMVQISSVRVAVSLHSDTVRFRTPLSETGQSPAPFVFGKQPA